MSAQRWTAFESLFLNATVGIIMVDSKGIIHLANPYAENLFRYGKEELNGKPLGQLLPEHLQGKHTGYLTGFFANPRARSMGAGLELFACKKDGELFPVEISLSYFHDEEKIIAVAFISDITKEREAGEKFFKIFHASPAAITFSELETGKIIDVNESFCRIVGFTTEELIGKTSAEMKLFADSKELEKMVQIISANKKISAHKIALNTKDHLIAWISLSAETVQINGKKFLITTYIDITEKKLVEENLRQREEGYRLIFNGIGEAFVLQEIIRNKRGEIIDLRFLEINPATETFFGKTRDQIVGHLRTELLGPLSNELKNIIDRVETTGETETGRDYMPLVDRWFDRSFYSPAKGQLVTINKDITENVHEEQMMAFLAKAEDRLWKMDTMKDGLKEILSTSIKLMDADFGDIQLFDPKTKKLHIVAEKGFGKEFLDFFKEVSADDDSACGRAFRERCQIVIEDIHNEPSFKPFLDIAEKTGFRSVQSTPLYENNDEPIGMISTHFRNARKFNPLGLSHMELYARKAESFIARLKNYETLRQMNLELEDKIKERTKELIASLEHEKELNESKSKFVSFVSHEFRTPLSVILSSIYFVDKYLEPHQESKRQKHIERIKDSVKNLTILLEDFLSIEKLELGKIEALVEEFDLKDLCEELTDEMITVLKKGQRIRLRYYGEPLVKQDKKILRNILLNLLSNAAKYSPENKESNFSCDSRQERVVIKVEDKGIGIPETEQNNIFSKFYRATNTAGVQGTGLGLNIVKKYVELIEGEIGFTSIQNEGTTFILEFPKK